ncbi:hypothetical protein [Mucilaginibacter aquariorum]|uniref:DUF4252 domain-containing protein n=1 Tax=Mucilaginibacter aquariorum TaxID=2967225 RepID=A0ABT1T2N7_9SPHI|nr:hypothetical protein [Mucilaginibacter aquariorum]MCQ6958877.1 hypothetical protein [Mucilaginibacter aquariorum]
MFKRILFLFFICTKAVAQTPDKDYLETLNSFSKHPFGYVAIPYAPDNRKKLIVENRALYEFYIKHNISGKYLNYVEFLKSAFANGISFNEKEIRDYHFIDDKSKVFKKYQSKGINFVITNYLIPLNKNQFRTKVTDDESLYTLIYIMSKNMYIASLSDYTGFYQFITVPEILERKKKMSRNYR